MLLASMSATIGNVSFGPLSESGGDLFDSFTWIILIVSQIIITILGITSSPWATVGKAWIVEAAFGIGSQHTIAISLELGDPAVL